MQFLSNTHGCEGWAGEMARRIRAFDWSATDLGPLDHWPGSLVSAVQMMLASPMPMVMLWGPAGYMIYNDSYSVFAGGRHPYLLGVPVELGWPEVADFNRHVVDTCLAGGTLSYRNLPLELLRDGRPEEVWMDLYYSPVAGDDQRPGGVLAIVVETTEHMISERLRQELTHNLEQRVAAEVQARSTAEEQLRQSQKLEAIGGLTGGVAHDFNNLLQVVAGAKLTSQLLAFARRQPLSPAVYNPLRIYEGLGELLQRALGETIHIDVQLPQDPWCIHVDRNQLENALLNLAINARDAMKGEGVIRITGENIILNPPDCIGKSINPGEYVRLAVTDSGAGMSPTILARAFEPFFTTKPDGHGTGLGLSMVFGFVRQSGGHVEVASEEGSGTVVQMYFPRSLAEPQSQEAPVELTQHTGGQETILVVEDNEGVRTAALELLEQSGYTVLTAEDGDRAMGMLRAGLQPDLIFTDVVMPGRVKSTDLAEWAREQVPAVAVLFTSGHTRDILSSNHLLSQDIHLLSKPYGPDELAQRVRSVLNSRMM